MNKTDEVFQLPVDSSFLQYFVDLKFREILRVLMLWPPLCKVRKWQCTLVQKPLLRSLQSNPGRCKWWKSLWPKESYFKLKVDARCRGRNKLFFIKCSSFGVAKEINQFVQVGLPCCVNLCNLKIWYALATRFLELSCTVILPPS